MRRISKIVYPMILLLLLSSCSSQSISAENNKDFKMTIPPLEESTTCSKDNSGKVMCVFEFEITSIADSPKTLSGEFFAVADEKIYLADELPNKANSISGTWNPDDKKSGYIAFTVPSKSNISSIFLGPKGSSSIESAFLIVPVNFKAIDFIEKESQDEEAAMKTVNEMLSRWWKVSEYPWDANPDLEEIENIEFVALIFKDKSATNTPEGGEYPECVGNIVTNVQSKSVIAFAKKYNGIVFEDLLSGLGIIIEKDVNDWEHCSYILSDTPGVRKLP